MSRRSLTRRDRIEQMVVTAEQMRAIESRIFAAGMPVAALMEKVAGLISQRIQVHYPRSRYPRVGILVGPGHNGGDALVVARELYAREYDVVIYQPLEKLKELTATHARYARSLGIFFLEEPSALNHCDVLVDGLFGFGLTRPISGALADLVQSLNQLPVPVLSIDLPSGIHTDTGEILGTAIAADRTLCLGLWKSAFFQEAALDYLGIPELVDFDIPIEDAIAIPADPLLRRITNHYALAQLLLPRPAATHKYRQGHLLLIGGSQQYMGAAILAGLGARASGVGMLSLAVPASLKPIVVAQLPEALVVACPEDDTGAIGSLPESIDPQNFSAIACGPGITQQATAIFSTVLASDRPLVLDADGLNILAHGNPSNQLSCRGGFTVLTPHPGEFKRLFPNLVESNPISAHLADAAARQTQATIVLKGARVAIAHPSGEVWFNPHSTPALARGGSGDVLTGLMGGLLAQVKGKSADLQRMQAMVRASVWWHAQAGLLAAQNRTELGVDACTLADYLIPAIAQHQTAATDRVPVK